jgi:16S rRNA (guanine527-N7)-methyltransferase
MNLAAMLCPGAMLREPRVVLAAGAETLGCPLSDAQIDLLLGYQALLLKWNKVYNLTALREPDEVLTHHLLDSVAALSPLRRHLAKCEGRILDVGSGGGLPGVVLAALAPELRVTCVDAVRKKASFIQQVAAELRLANLSAVHARVERMEGEPYDVIASRAFASLADFVRLTQPLLGAEGAWMAMKGKVPTEEIAALPSECEMFHVEHLAIPGLGAERCLVWMRPAQRASTA